jgi:hypothetical protein
MFVVWRYNDPISNPTTSDTRCHVYVVTTDEVWICEWMYRSLIHTTLN